MSKSELLELSEDKNKIRRKTPPKVKPNVEDCTIYVEHIKSDTNHEWLTSAFSDFGNVVYVSIPKYKHNHMNKGFAFIEFENESGAKNALDYFESIDCKISSELPPEELQSIVTFESDNTEKVKDSSVVKDTNAEIEEDSNKCQPEVEEKSKNKECKLSKNESNVGTETKVQTDENATKCQAEVEEKSQNTKRKLSSDESNDITGKKVKTDKSDTECQAEVEVNIQNTKRKLSTDENDGAAEKKVKLDKTDSIEDKKKNKKVKKKCQFKEMGLQILSK